MSTQQIFASLHGLRDFLPTCFRKAYVLPAVSEDLVSFVHDVSDQLRELCGADPGQEEGRAGVRSSEPFKYAGGGLGCRAVVDREGNLMWRALDRAEKRQPAPS